MRRLVVRPALMGLQPPASLPVGRTAAYLAPLAGPGGDHAAQALPVPLAHARAHVREPAATRDEINEQPGTEAAVLPRQEIRHARHRHPRTTPPPSPPPPLPPPRTPAP